MAHRAQEDGASSAASTSLVADVASVLGLAATVGLALALYLRAPIERALTVPSGADIPVHLWRARLVTTQGLRALFSSAPLSIQTNPDRLGLPVLASILSGLGVTPWRLMYVTAAVGAAVLAASAWGLARAIPEPRWGAPIYAVAAAASIPFALTSRAYLDNTLAEGMIVAIAAVVLLAAERPGTTTAGVVLMGGTLLMHWPTGTLFVAVLALFALSLVPQAWRERRTTPLIRSGAARVGTIAGGGLALGGLPLLATPGANAPTQGTGALFVKNVGRLLPFYRLPVTLPLAAAGGAALGWLRPATPRRRALLLYVAWLVPLGFSIVVYLRVKPVPVMRFLGTALPIPLLGAAALIALLMLPARLPIPEGPSTALTSALSVGVLAVLAAFTVHAAHSVDKTTPSITPFELRTVRAADAYIASVDPPAAVVVADGPTTSFRRIRMLAPGTIVDRIRIFPGDAGDLFTRAASSTPVPIDPSLTGFKLRTAQIAADAVVWMQKPGAIALALSPYVRDYGALLSDPANVEVADGVLVLRPATAPVASPPAPLRPPPGSALVVAALVAFSAIAAAGSGWSVALLAHLRSPDRPTSAWELQLALAPAIGLAMIVIVGSLLGLAGARTGGVDGLVIWFGVAAAGWVAVVAGARSGAAGS